VSWEAQGLEAEYFQMNRELSSVPDLTGLAPTRLSFIGAVNYPNPKQVFGADPMGVGLGKNYVVRLTGKLRIDTAGNYQFAVRAHAGARLSIDGRLIAQAVAG